MNRQAQLITVGLVVAVLAVVATLMATTGSPRNAAQSTAPGEASTSPGSPGASGSAEPAEPSASAASSAPASGQPKVRLPKPSAEPTDPARSAKQRQRREAKARRALVPAEPELEAGSLACVEAIAQRRTLRAATFNIHGGFGRGRLDLTGIGNELARLEADVVLLQEVDRGRKRSRRQDQARILADRLGMEVAYHPTSGRRSGGAIGNAVLSRYPITSVRRATLPRGGAEPRGVMRVVLDVDNVEVAAYVTHLEHTSGAVRRRQMRSIAKVLRRESVPHLVGGDLNANPRSQVLDIARTVLDDAWPAAGQGQARTVPRARIDYLLHGPTLRAVRAMVVPSRVSDHDAVLGAFEVGAPEACQQG